MKNSHIWKPSKFVYRKGKLRASRDEKEVSVSSRLIVDKIAAYFDMYLCKYCHGRLVDLGCGSVPLYEAYKPYILENVCVDWQNSEHRNIYLDKECDLTKKLPFKNMEFDTIILSDVLEHIPEPDLLFSEMYRILRKSGMVFISVPFYYWIHEAPYDYYRYTEYALRRLAKKYKFKVLELEAIGGAQEIIADIVAKNVVTIPLIGKTMAVFVQKIIGFISNSTGLGIKANNESKKLFPFAYFMILEKIDY